MAEKFPKVGVGVFIIKNKKFLMGKRIGSHQENTWCLPGGHLEFGESFEQSAIREVEEETGLQIHNLRFAAVTNDHFEAEDKHYVEIFLLADWLSGEPTITEPDRYIEQKWVDFSELPEPLFQSLYTLQNSEFFPNIKSAIENS